MATQYDSLIPDAANPYITDAMRRRGQPVDTTFVRSDAPDGSFENQTDGLTRRLRSSAMKFESNLPAVEGLARQVVGDQEGAQKAYQEYGDLQQRAQAIGPDVQTMDDVRRRGSTPEAYAEFAATKTADFIPDILATVATGGFGGAVGGTIVRRAGLRAATAAAERQVAKEAAPALAEAVVKSQGSDAAERLARRQLVEETTQRTLRDRTPEVLAAQRATEEAAVKAGQSVGSTAGQYPGVVADSVEALKNTDQEGALKIGGTDIVSAAFGSLPAGRFLSRLGGGAARQAIEESARKILPRVTKEFATQGAFEGGVGVVQAAIQLAGHWWVNDNVDLLGPEAFDRYLAEAVGGFFAGGTISGVHTAGAASVERWKEGAQGRGEKYNALKERLVKNIRAAGAAAESKLGDTRDRVRAGETEGAPRPKPGDPINADGSPANGADFVVSPDGTTVAAGDSTRASAADFFAKAQEGLNRAVDAVPGVAAKAKAGIDSIIDRFKKTDAQVQNDESIEADADGLTRKTIEEMVRQFESGAADAELGAAGDRAPNTNPILLDNKLQDVLATTFPKDDAIWQQPAALRSLMRSVEKIFTNDKRTRRDDRNIAKMQAWFPEKVARWEAANLDNDGYGSAMKLAQADTRAQGQTARDRAAERATQQTEIERNVRRDPTADEIAQTATDDEQQLGAGAAFEGINAADAVRSSPLEQLTSVDPQSREYPGLQRAAREELLGGTADEEVSGFPGGNESRIFKEGTNEKLYNEKLNSASTVKTDQTFRIGGVQRAKLLELGNLVQYQRAKEPGISVRDAIARTVADLKLAGVDVDPRTFNAGEVKTVKGESVGRLSPRDVAFLRGTIDTPKFGELSLQGDSRSPKQRAAQTTKADAAPGTQAADRSARAQKAYAKALEEGTTTAKTLDAFVAEKLDASPDAKTERQSFDALQSGAEEDISLREQAPREAPPSARDPKTGERVSTQAPIADVSINATHASAVTGAYRARAKARESIATSQAKIATIENQLADRAPNPHKLQAALAREQDNLRRQEQIVADALADAGRKIGLAELQKQHDNNLINTREYGKQRKALEEDDTVAEDYFNRARDGEFDGRPHVTEVAQDTNNVKRDDGAAERALIAAGEKVFGEDFKYDKRDNKAKSLYNVLSEKLTPREAAAERLRQAGKRKATTPEAVKAKRELREKYLAYPAELRSKLDLIEAARDVVDQLPSGDPLRAAYEKLVKASNVREGGRPTEQNTEQKYMRPRKREQRITRREAAAKAADAARARGDVVGNPAPNLIDPVTGKPRVNREAPNASKERPERPAGPRQEFVQSDEDAAAIHDALGKEGIPASHVSVHKFDQFNWREHKNTGEGQMVFGAGVYLSTSNGVNRAYKDGFEAKFDESNDPANDWATSYDSVDSVNKLLRKLPDSVKNRAARKTVDRLDQALRAAEGELEASRAAYDKSENRLNDFVERHDFKNDKALTEQHAANKKAHDAAHDALLAAAEKVRVARNAAYDGTKYVSQRLIKSQMTSREVDRIGTDDLDSDSQLVYEDAYNRIVGSPHRYNTAGAVDAALDALPNADRVRFASELDAANAKVEAAEGLVRNMHRTGDRARADELYEKLSSARDEAFDIEADIVGTALYPKLSDKQKATVDAAKEVGPSSHKEAMRDAYNEIYFPAPLTKAPTYQVTVNAKPGEILDFDKNLGEQHPDVQKKLIEAFPGLFEGMEDAIDGEVVYRGLADTLGSDEAASDALQGIGIVGHSFSANGGRDTTHPNYVVYDDSRIETNFVQFDESIDTRTLSQRESDKAETKRKEAVLESMLVEDSKHDIKAEEAMVNEMLARLGVTEKIQLLPSEDRPGVDDGSYRGAAGTIFINERLSGPERVEVLMHEVGHHVIRVEVAKAMTAAGNPTKASDLGYYSEENIFKMLKEHNPELHAALRKDYLAWKKANPKSTTRVDLKISKKPIFRAARLQDNRDSLSKATVESGSPKDQKYDYSFDEYLADGIAKALTSKPEATDVVGQFFKNIADQLRKVWDAIFNSSAMKEAGTPPSVDKWIQSLFDANVRDVSGVVGPVSKATADASIRAAVENAFQGPVFPTRPSKLNTGAPPPPGPTPAQPNTPPPRDPKSFRDMLRFVRGTMRIPDRKILERVLSRGAVDKRLQEIYKDNPGALRLLDDAKHGLEGRIALAYFAWKDGKLTTGPEATNALFDINDTLRSVLNVSSDGAYAQRIFDDIATGYISRVEAAGKTYDIKDLENRARGKLNSALNHFSDFTAKVSEPLSKFWDSKMSRAFNSGIPAYRHFASLIQRPGGKTGDDRGLNPSVVDTTARYVRQAGRVFEGLSERDAHKAMTYLQNGTRRLPERTSPQIRSAIDKARRLMDDLHAYAKDAGVDLPHRANYWPVVLDLRNETAKTRLTKLYDQPHFHDRIRELFGSKDKPSDKPMAELVKNLVDGAVQGEHATAPTTGAGTPNFKAANYRLSQFVYDLGSPADIDTFAALQSKDPAEVLGRYVEPLVKRAEHARRFGDDGAKTTKLLDQMKAQGATDAQIAEAKDTLKAALGTYGAEGSPLLAKVSPDLAKRLATPRTRSVLHWLQAYQNARLLPLALLSSLVDPIGIAVRTGGDFKTAWSGFKLGMKALTDKGTRDDIHRLLETLGSTEDIGTLEALQQGLGGGDSPGSRKVNDFVFKWNGLQGWVRATRYMALKSANGFMLKHAAGEGVSGRYLRELGLKPGDVQPGDGGNVKILTDAERASATPAEVRRDDRVRKAMMQFVDEAILRPNSQQTPLWYSDPYVGLVTQYKAFGYALYDQIGGRIAREMGQGNLKVLLPALAYLPVTIAAELLRELLQYGPDGNPKRKEWGATEYTGLAVSKQLAMRGPKLEIQSDIVNDFKKQRTPGSSQLGPTISQAVDVLDGGSASSTLEAALPASALWKRWNDDEPADTERKRN